MLSDVRTVKSLRIRAMAMMISVLRSVPVGSSRAVSGVLKRPCVGFAFSSNMKEFAEASLHFTGLKDETRFKNMEFA